VANVKLRLTIAVVLTAFVAGCGGGDDNEGTATPASGGGGGGGQKLFVDNCGNCHTMAAAGASGKVGPDMDQLRPGPDLVNAQVTNGGGGMPAFKGKLSPEQITELSNYVADNAGKG
jgi:mono/diheme cytochrome c family protein